MLDKYQKIIRTIDSIVNLLKSPPPGIVRTGAIKPEISEIFEHDSTKYSRNLPSGSIECRDAETHLLHCEDGPALTDSIGGRFWYKQGVLHRTDGPAMKTDFSEIFFKDGEIHREDGPACIMTIPETGGTYTCWFFHGVPHRTGEPCLELYDGTQVYIDHGSIHREDGPAIILPNGAEIWMRRGQIHREWGPAVIDGSVKLHCRYGRQPQEQRPTFKWKNLTEDVQSLSKKLALAMDGVISYEDESQYCISTKNGDEFWYKLGTLQKHRVDGPAVSLASGKKIFYKDGLIHRDGAPAIISEDGSEFYYHNGVLNSPDSFTPAVNLTCGTQIYMHHGKLHRNADLPAAILAEENGDLTNIWAKDGVFHRNDCYAPAVMWGGSHAFNKQTAEVLSRLNIPLRKKMNRNEFFFNGTLVAEVDSRTDQAVGTRVLAVGGSYISAYGTAKFDGDLNWEGITGGEIRGGTLTINSNNKINFKNCIIKDATVFLTADVGDISGNYLVNSRIVVTNVSNSEFIAENILDSNSKVERGLYESSPPRAISEEELGKASERASEAHRRARSQGELFFSESDITNFENKIDERVKMDHLTEAELRDFVVSHIKDSTNNIVGSRLTEREARGMRDKIAEAINAIESHNTSVIAAVDPDDRMKINVNVKLPVDFTNIPITFVQIPEATEAPALKETCEPDEEEDSSLSWAGAVGALGVAAAISYLAKPKVKEEKQSVSKREVKHATI